MDSVYVTLHPNVNSAINLGDLFDVMPLAQHEKKIPAPLPATVSPRSQPRLKLDKVELRAYERSVSQPPHRASQ
jgi:hypothetical protein